jgi:O-antigen/teichoic acid export membrane protein
VGSRILRNTALVLTARVASSLLALVTVIVMEVHLRPSGFGVFGDVVNLAALATVFLDEFCRVYDTAVERAKR